MTFSKQDTNKMKGFALLLMMFHHCFLENRFENYTNISLFPMNAEQIGKIARGGKVCVGIFLFLSAYGMACSFFKKGKELNFDRKEAEQFTVRRLMNLYSGYWAVYIVVFLLSYVMPNTKYPHTVYFKEGKNLMEGGWNFFLDFMGVGDLFYGNPLMGTWWYMGLAIGLIVMFPIFMKLYRSCGIALVPAMLFSYAMFSIPVTAYSRFLLLVPLGIYFADQNLFVKIKNKKIVENRIWNQAIKFFFVSVLMIIAEYDFIQSYKKMTVLTPLRDALTVILVLLWGYLFLAQIPVVEKILEYLGIHSMNIFLAHSFLRVRWAKEHIYSFPHFTIVILVLVLESLVLSILIEWIKKRTRYDKMMQKLREFIVCSL